MKNAVKIKKEAKYIVFAGNTIDDMKQKYTEKSLQDAKIAVDDIAPYYRFTAIQKIETTYYQNIVDQQ